MIDKNTVLILGAGASHPFGYPIGSGLKKKILEKANYPLNRLNDVNNQETVHNEKISLIGSWDLIPRYLLKNCGFNPDQISQFNTQFAGSHKASIDSFLENRAEYLTLGKALIAMSIFEFESYDLLFNDDEQNWYKYLLRNIHDNWDNFPENKLSIITYNYDRSFEYFLLNDLAMTYGKNNKVIKDKLKLIPFEHVHGAIDSLPSDYFPGYGKQYKQDFTGENINNAMQNLHLIYEEAEVKKAYGKVHEILNKAEHIFILGFGFDKRNLERLDLLKNASKAQIFATRTGISNLEVNTINRKFEHKIIFSRDETHDIVNFFRREVNLNGDVSFDTRKFNVQQWNPNNI